MASLQTLRNKGGIIVAVIIGLALLAFVLGDMLSSGSTLFGNANNNVGQIDDHEVTAIEYGAQINYLTEVQKISTGSETVSEEQTQAIQTQAWEQLVRQYAIEPALAQAGLLVPTAEMAELLSGRYISPIVQQIFANPQTGYFDAQYLHQFVASLDQDPSGRMQLFWKYIQSEVAAQSLLMKYKTLVDKAIYVTSAEAEVMARIESNAYDVRFAAATYASVSDSTITVDNSEAKAWYEKNKARFERETVRSIDYVVFNALPSDSDYAAAARYVNELAEELRTTTNVKQFASLNSQQPFDSRYYKEGELTGDLGTFAFAATTDAIYGPELVGDEYTLARMSEVKVLPDSISISHIVVENKTTADSLARAINPKDAEAWATAAATYSLDKQTGAKAGLVGMLDPQTLGAEFAAPLLGAASGSIVVVASPQGGFHVVKINERKGEEKKIQLGVIRYSVEASKETRSTTFARATEFERAAGKDGFDAATKAAVLNKQNARLGANDRTVQGIAGSRELVRWAYNNKVGDQSTILEFGNQFVLASLATVAEQGIAPFDAVKADVEAAVRREKKGVLLAGKLAGVTSIEEAGVKLGSAVMDGTGIDFNTFIVPEVGYDAGFAGGICGAGKLGLTKPIVGVTGVYMAEVVNVIDNPIQAAVAREKIGAERQQNAFMAVYQTLMEQSKIVDERYKFY